MDLAKESPILRKMSQGKEVLWINSEKTDFASAMKKCALNAADVEDAEARLHRFAPFIMRCFPETSDQEGLIESPLTPIPQMQDLLAQKYDNDLPGRLFLKQDNALAVAGSVKARGGIYEVLRHAEDLAIENDLLTKGENYAKLAEPEYRDFFSQYKIQVGSTGNLGMSIGIMGAALGFQVVVHMSSDARKWKKDLLRSRGVQVREYDSDYSEAVKIGRRQSDDDPKSYFVDDENSRSLFLGYATAAKRLAGQLKDQGITVDHAHPLFVYLPCGVGGAPGGISFGLKQIYRDDVHCFFVEPVQAPCMLLGLITGKNHGICVQDIGLSGKTHADGLAVGRPSGFVGEMMAPMISGEFTVSDAKLYDYMHDLLETEEIFLEPSACAAFQGPALFGKTPEMQNYLEKNDLNDQMAKSTHIAWGTGGSLVPQSVREEYLATYL